MSKCLKQEFISRREALEVLKLIRDRNKSNGGRTKGRKCKRPHRVYECKQCRHYHLTSTKAVR